MSTQPQLIAAIDDFTAAGGEFDMLIVDLEDHGIGEDLAGQADALFNDLRRLASRLRSDQLAVDRANAEAAS